SLGFCWLETARVWEALRIINSARAVVSVDTGLMHLAVHQGKPTVTLFGQLPVYYRPYDNCHPFFVKSCSDSCLTALEQSTDTSDYFKVFDWYDGQFEQCKENEDERCMSSIDPQDVFRKIQQIIQTKSPASVAER